jgi:hypothetical protein
MTATNDSPGEQMRDAQRTTLLDLLFELRPLCNSSEQSLVAIALDRITRRKVVLCGTFLGAAPSHFR